MTIILLQQMSGLRAGVPWPDVGETLEVGDDEGASLCAVFPGVDPPIAVEVVE